MGEGTAVSAGGSGMMVAVASGVGKGVSVGTDVAGGRGVAMAVAVDGGNGDGDETAVSVAVGKAGSVDVLVATADNGVDSAVSGRLPCSSKKITSSSKRPFRASDAGNHNFCCQ